MCLASEHAARDFVARQCDAGAMAKLDRLVELLLVAGEVQNLVSRATLPVVWQRHIADSAQLLLHVPRETSPWLDLGSGAGFPGLVIAIMRPKISMILIESRRLRIQWLEDAITALDCRNCRVIGKDLRDVETFHAAVISARAFAPMARLVALSTRFSTSRTQWLLPKGRSAGQEVAQLPEGQRQMFHVEQSLTDTDAGIVIGEGNPEMAA